MVQSSFQENAPSKPGPTAAGRGNAATGKGARKRWMLLTIDTEGDNLWSRTAKVTANNALFMPRFQELCERYGFKPTYLTNYEMAIAPAFQDLGRDIVRRGTGEVGMHLHAWNSPPDYPLTDSDHRHHPYATDYPENVLRAKVETLTSLLQDTFGVRMLSHRGGRWCFNTRYAQILYEYGYRLDCSVTPGISWDETPGNPTAGGGSDFRNFPDYAYFMDMSDISRPGDSDFLQVPMTIRPSFWKMLDGIKRCLPKLSIARRGMEFLFPSTYWLRPRRFNLSSMLSIVRRSAAQGRDYVEFMMHSSELMHGGSPLFELERDIDVMYDSLERLFDEIRSLGFRGATCREYYDYAVSLAKEPRNVSP